MTQQRTPQQNKALHLWFRLKADQCRDAGVTAQMVFAKTIELEMNESMMKTIFKYVLEARTKKKSTTELSKTMEIDDHIEHLNRFFAEKFNLGGIELPSTESEIPTHQPLETDYEGEPNFDVK